MIILNRIETPDGTQITSHHVHDYVEHKDENGHTYAVDGGKEYLRRVGPLGYKDLSVTTKDTFEVVREAFLWGSYGKNGDEALRRIPLCELTDEHIQAILDTQKHISDEVRGLFVLEKVWRTNTGKVEPHVEDTSLNSVEDIGDLLLQVILGSGEYNGHKQTTLDELPKVIALGLCEFLEENLQSSAYLRMYSDGGGSLYQEDYWEEGGHINGHKDRLLLGIDKIT